MSACRSRRTRARRRDVTTKEVRRILHGSRLGRRKEKDIQKRPIVRTVRQARRMVTMCDLGRGGMEEAAHKLHEEWDYSKGPRPKGGRGPRRKGEPNSLQKQRHELKDSTHATTYRYFNEEGVQVGHASVHSDGGRTVYVDPRTVARASGARCIAKPKRTATTSVRPARATFRPNSVTPSVSALKRESRGSVVVPGCEVRARRLGACGAADRQGRQARLRTTSVSSRPTTRLSTLSASAPTRTCAHSSSR